jgi:peptidase S41-like protein
MRTHLALFGAIFALLALAKGDPSPLASAATSPAGPPSAAETPAHSPMSTLVDQLDKSQLQEVIQQLRSNYVDQRELTSDEINQATVQGLLSRLGPGVMLQTRADAEKPSAIRPFKTEIIGNHFGYIRFGTLSKDTVSRLDAALIDFRTRGFSGVILDLRTSGSGGDFQVAADLVNRFVPKGKLLFKLVEPKTNQGQLFTSSTDPLYRGPVAIVVDQDTAGAAEAIAETLKVQDHALILGQKTAGTAVEYQHYLIGNSLVLTMAVRQLMVPEGPAIFPNGLQPDIPVTFSETDERNILKLTDTQSITPFVVDEERPRTNEAALVAGTNPEIDAYEAQEAGKSPVAKPKDLVLQRAIDFLTTVSVYRGR